MGGVAVELRTLMRTESIFDGQLMQTELTGKLVKLFLGGTAYVDPHHRVRLHQVLGDVGNWEASASEAFTIQPG